MNEQFNINREIILKICQYVDKLTQNLNNHRNDVYSFKSDLKFSIIIIMEEHLSKGYNAEDAFKAAIFTCENSEITKTQLNNLNINNKNSQKLYFKISCTFLIISLLLIIMGYIHNIITINSTFYLKSSPIIKNNIGSDNNLITENMKNSLKDFIENRWFIEAGALYTSDVTQSKIISKNFIYTYISKGKITDTKYTFNKRSDLLFSYYTHHDYFIVPNSAKTVDAVYEYKILGNGFFAITFILFLVYWITFVVWASFNISYAEFDIHWIILIFLFNFFGYIIFEYSLNKERNLVND